MKKTAWNERTICNLDTPNVWGFLSMMMYVTAEDFAIKKCKVHTRGKGCHLLRPRPHVHKVSRFGANSYPNLPQISDSHLETHLTNDRNLDRFLAHYTSVWSNYDQRFLTVSVPGWSKYRLREFSDESQKFGANLGIFTNVWMGMKRSFTCPYNALSSV